MCREIQFSGSTWGNASLFLTWFILYRNFINQQQNKTDNISWESCGPSTWKCSFWLSFSFMLYCSPMTKQVVAEGAEKGAFSTSMPGQPQQLAQLFHLPFVTWLLLHALLISLSLTLTGSWQDNCPLRPTVSSPCKICCVNNLL